MSSRRVTFLTFGVLALTSVVTAAVYPRLPERMATHFDVHGVPNGWMPRAWGAWFVPVLAGVIWALLSLLPRALPRSEARRLGEGPVATIGLALVAFLSAVHVVVLRFSLAPGSSTLEPIVVLMGGLFVALGLVMPRVRRNALIGVRTPWSLASDENWAQTQRVGGYAMVLGGLAAIVGGLVGGTAALVLGGAGVLASAVVPTIYSLVYARRHDPESGARGRH